MLSAAARPRAVVSRARPSRRRSPRPAGVARASMATAAAAVTGSAPHVALPLLFAATLVPCCLGFVDAVAVFSTGYGLAVAAAGLAVVSAAPPGSAALAHAALLVAYGVRLFAFLFWRQTWGDPTWRERSKKSPEAQASVRAVPVLACALFYALMTSPCLWHVRAAAAGVAPASAAVVQLGLGMALVGVVLEAAADFQKSWHKARSRTTWCSGGLYAVIRHPNYLGEMLFWAGNFVAGVQATAAAGPYGWPLLPATLGLIGILGLMWSVTPRLDKRQMDKYAGDGAATADEYKAYVGRTKLLVPGIY